MTETADWQQIFDSVKQIPGGTKPTKKKLTEKDLQERNAWLERRRAADIAVAHGMVDDGERNPWAWLSEWSTGIVDDITENTDAIANLTEIAAAINTTQAWVSDADDMATIPRASVTSLGFGSTTFNRPKYIDVEQIYDLTSTANRFAFSGVTPVFKPKVVTGSSQGHIYYTPIVVNRSGTPDKFRWKAGADTSAWSINYYEVALCVYNPTPVGGGAPALEKVWGSGNIKDAEADTVVLDEVSISMGLSQTVTPGQILFAAHQQTAPGGLQQARRIAAVGQPDHSRNVDLLDAWCYIAENYSQGIPSSIPFASLTRENTFVPWMAVSVLSGS